MLDLATGFKGLSSIAPTRRKAYNFTPRHPESATLKLHAERIEGTNAIARHGKDGVMVNGTQFTSSVVVPWTGIVTSWNVARFAELTVDHFAALVQHDPELVLFGSGEKLRFPPASLLRSLIERRIGFETMDTAAACRTYNVLLSEGRNVVAALLFEQ
ncbi:MAG: Mth938-like domain-containing protein [Rhizobacter sp.]